MLAIVIKDQMQFKLKNGSIVQPWYTPSLETILADMLDQTEDE